MMHKILRLFGSMTLLLSMLAACSTLKPTDDIDLKNKKLLQYISNFKNIESMRALTNQADKLVEKRFKNILDKKIIAESGNVNDYSSRAIYYWPNNNLMKTQNKTEAWQYIDGKINKESLTETDHNNYYEMLAAIKELSLAYYFSNEDKYAAKTTDLIKEWFINDKTKMNPNFNYAQAIPGKNNGTPSGIIDARGILWVIDAISFIEESRFWSKELNNSFKDWCSNLLDWLLGSEFGQREGNSENNHGTFYELQIIKLSSYLGKPDLMKGFMVKTKNRIERQIAPDGSQPLELKRASAHMYSIFNLSALVELAQIANLYEIDLWSYKTNNCGSIEDAVNYLVSKYEINDTKPFKGKVSYKNLLRILPKANEITEGKYNKVIENIKAENRDIDLTELYFVN